jgi:peptidyl-prolyl cis-trans isomerase SurA
MKPASFFKICFLFAAVWIPFLFPERSLGQAFIESNRILATVNNEVITLHDYKNFLVEIGEIRGSREIDEVHLKKMIEEKVILQEAQKRGFEVTDGEVNAHIQEYRANNVLSQEEMEKELVKIGMNGQAFKNLMKEKALIMKLITTEVDSKVMVTEKEIEAFYSENKKNYLMNPEKTEVKAIFIKLDENASVTEITDLKRRALWIAAQLKNGESFERLSEKYSDETLRNQSGRLGTFVRGSLIPALDNRAFSMKPDEVSDPVWVSEGVYILKVTNRTTEEVKPFKEVHEEIKNHLFLQNREKIFNEWMKTLWEKTSVIIK